AGPEDLIEPDALVPEDVGPELDADDQHHGDEQHDRDHDDRHEPRPDREAAITRPADARSARAWRRWPAPVACFGWRPAECPPPSGSAERDRPRLIRRGLVVEAGRVGQVRAFTVSGFVVAGSKLVIEIVVFLAVAVRVGVVVAGRTGALRRAATGRFGLTAPKLLHEVVEQISHSARSLAPTDVRGLRPT